MTYYAKVYQTSIADVKPEPKIKEHKKINKVKKSTGERIIFGVIWNTRPHKSFISGSKITDARPINFLHVLPKGQNKYPEFKLLKKNIVLGTDEEHFVWDNARHTIEPNDKNWKKMFDLEAELLIEYKKLHRK